MTTALTPPRGREVPAGARSRQKPAPRGPTPRPAAPGGREAPAGNFRILLYFQAYLQQIFSGPSIDEKKGKIGCLAPWPRAGARDAQNIRRCAGPVGQTVPERPRARVVPSSNGGRARALSRPAVKRGRASGLGKEGVFVDNGLSLRPAGETPAAKPTFKSPARLRRGAGKTAT
jgi:hypothetical protein